MYVKGTKEFKNGTERLVGLGLGSVRVEECVDSRAPQLKLDLIITLR